MFLNEDREKDSVKYEKVKESTEGKGNFAFCRKETITVESQVYLDEAPPACLRLSKPPGNCPSIAGLVTLSQS